jgi:hypothetical protein
MKDKITPCFSCCCQVKWERTLRKDATCCRSWKTANSIHYFNGENLETNELDLGRGQTTYMEPTQIWFSNMIWTEITGSLLEWQPPVLALQNFRVHLWRILSSLTKRCLVRWKSTNVLQATFLRRSVDFQWATLHYIPEDRTLHNDSSQSFKFCTVYLSAFLFRSSCMLLNCRGGKNIYPPNCVWTFFQGCEHGIIWILYRCLLAQEKIKFCHSTQCSDLWNSDSLW